MTRTSNLRRLRREINLEFMRWPTTGAVSLEDSGTMFKVRDFFENWTPEDMNMNVFQSLRIFLEHPCEVLDQFNS